MPSFCGYPDGPCCLWHGEHKHHSGNKRAMRPDADVAVLVKGMVGECVEFTAYWVADDEAGKLEEKVFVESLSSWVRGARCGFGDEDRRIVRADSLKRVYELLGVPGWFNG